MKKLLIAFVILFLPLCVAQASSLPGMQEMQAQYDVAMADCALRTRPFSFGDITAPGDTVRVYEKFEVTFGITEEFSKADYFDPAVVDIFAYVTTPSNTIERVPAFLLGEDGLFAVRYAARAEGLHTLYVRNEKNGAASNTISFTALPAREGSRGYLHADGGRLVDDHGAQFTLFGTNYAWGSVAEFNTNMSIYKANGMNFIRFWGQCPWSPFNLERSPQVADGKPVENEVQNGSEVRYEGLGILSLDNAERMDSLVGLLEDNDIYMMYTWRNLWEFASKHWKTNPYNTENGGMCMWKTNKTNFWTHPLAVKYQQQALRYLVARYGYSPNFSIFEFWNECDNKVTAQTSQESAQWHKIMDGYYKSLNIYSTLTTTSYAWLDHGEMNARNPWIDLPFLDLFNGHRYTEAGQDPLPVWEKQVQGLRDAAQGVEKPVFFGEFSEDNAENKEGGPVQDNYFKEGIYAPFFFMNTCGTSLHWRVNGTFMPSAQMLEYMRIASSLISPFGSRLPDMAFSTDTQGDLRTGSYSNAQALLMYVRKAPADGQAFYTLTQRETVQDAQVTVPGLSGRCTLRFYDLETGALLAEQALDCDAGGTQAALPPFPMELLITGESL